MPSTPTASPSSVGGSVSGTDPLTQQIERGLVATMWQAVPMRRYISSKLKAEHFQDLDAYQVFQSLVRGHPVPLLPFSAAPFTQADTDNAINAVRRAHYHRAMSGWSEQLKQASMRHDDRRIQELVSNMPMLQLEKTHITLEEATKNLMTELLGDNMQTVRLVSPGLQPLDLLFYPNSIYLIAGKPGTGKSALAEQILLDLSSQGAFCLDISIELNEQLRTQRYHQHIGGNSFSPRSYVEGKWDPDRIQDVFDKASYLFDDKGKIAWPRRLTLDPRSTSLPDILASIRLWLHGVREQQEQLEASGIQAQVGPPVVLIDFLQIISLPGETEPYKIVSEAAQQLYALAKEENIALIWVSQLRKDDKRKDPMERPSAEDLEGSERMRQLAHHILMLSRPVGAWTSGDWTKIVVDAPKVRTGMPYLLETAYNGTSLEFNADPVFISSLPKTKAVTKR